jgi:ubiquinone/menaquinone biosynthesis C-methylase UbiE
MTTRNKKENNSWARNKAVSIHDETADWFASQYSKKQDRFSSSFAYGRQQINKYLFEEISKLQKGAKILDIGCGTGEHLKQLFDYGFDVIGIEPSENMRKYAEDGLPKGRVINGSILNLPFEDKSFDFVYAIEVFRYLDKEDNARGFKEIFRVLKPGGLFFGTFLNFYASDGFTLLTALRRLKKQWFGKSLKFHSEFETPKKLEKKLLITGFSEVQTHGAMILPLTILYRINKPFGKICTKVLEPIDSLLSNIPLFRSFGNYLIAIAKK